VQFQDEISLDKRKAVQEKKMAILENALRELPQNESLILAYMDIARDKLE
jgi:hypothetical protein